MTDQDRHNRRGLGMRRHYVPTHAGGSIDAVRTANPNPPPPNPQPIGKPQPTVAPSQAMPIQQAPLPVGGRAADRQNTQ